MNRIILDSSAFLAFVNKEGGHENLPQNSFWVISAVNFAEVLSKLLDWGSAHMQNVVSVEGMLHQIVPLKDVMARRIGEIRQQTKSYSLSLADRASIVLAMEWQLQVYTADRAWSQLGCPS